MTSVDIPRHVLIPFPHLVSEAGTILLVSDVTLASARDTIRLRSWFKQNIPGARVILVANKLQNGIGELSRKEYESSVERAIDVTRSEEHTSELQHITLISIAASVLRTKNKL